MDPSTPPEPVVAPFACPKCSGSLYEPLPVQHLGQSAKVVLFNCTRCHFAFVDPAKHQPDPAKHQPQQAAGAGGRPGRPLGRKAVSNATSRERVKGGTIVVAEDYDDAREALAVSLTVLGYTVHAARSGAEALALIEAHQPKAVIADLHMAGGDGFELATKVRATHSAAIRLIAVTGLPPRAAWSRAMESGFDYYLVKPITTEELIPYIEGPLYPRAEDV